MRPSHRVFLILAFLVFLTGMLAVLFSGNPGVTPLPRLPSSASVPAVGLRQQPPVEDLARPWAKRPLPPLVKVSVQTPAPVEALISEPVPDRTSVRYLGTLIGETGVKTYLFKYVPKGQALVLVENQETQGWKLSQVTPQQFSLQGPGGFYAVPRP